MRFRHALCLPLALGWAIACGGRYQQTVEGDDAPSAGSSAEGGTTSSAGTRSRGGTKGGGSAMAGRAAVGGSGVVSGGATAAAGSVGIAAAPSGGSIAVCDAIACAFPYRAVPDPSGCYHCELDQMACDASHDRYRQFRAILIDKYSQGCTQDTDCIGFHDQNLCGTFDCGSAVLTALSPSLAENLGSYAQTTCSPDCPPEPVLPCKAPAPIRCVANRCQ